MRLPAFDPELIIFDCDGVLVDTERVNNQVMADLVGELGVPMSFAEAVELYIGKSTEDCLRITEARLGRPAPDDLHARWVARTRELHARELRAVEGITAKRLMQEHRKKGMPESLMHVLHLAALADVRMLVFDADAQVLDGLPIYDD